MKSVAAIWNPIDAVLTFIGECAQIFWDAFKRIGRAPREWPESLNQMGFIGAASVPIVAMTGFFSGAVLSLYLTEFLLRYGGQSFVGATVAISVAREIGPVLAGVTVAARCASSMAAQIGTMKVTEQIDALKMLSVDPSDYLVLPRLYAGITMMPILALVCMYAGVAGGWLVAVSRGVPSAAFVQSVQQYVHPWDFLGGMLKAPFFGFVIALVACQQGMRTTQGAVGVGKATTNTVVISIVLVYALNFFLAQVFFG